MSVRQFGTVGLIAIGYFVVAVVALHFLEPDFSPVNEYTSDDALGESFGWLMRTAFFAAGIGTLSIALGIRKTLAPGKRVKASFALLAVVGVAFVVVGLFNTDPTLVTDLTTTGTVHNAASVVVFIGLLVAAWFLRGVFKRDRSWEQFSQAQMWFAIAYTVTFIGTGATPEGGAVGLTQHIFIAVMMGWLATLAWKTRQIGSILDSGGLADNTTHA